MTNPRDHARHPQRVGPDAATDSAGRELGIFLPRGTLVRGGDVLVAEDGSMVRVIAAPQPVLDSDSYGPKRDQ